MNARAKEESLVWNDELATGVPMLDEQHQAIFSCVTELERAVGEKTMLSTFHAMEQLRSYVHEHFAEEERLMTVSGYPDIEAHAAEHREFRHRLYELRRTYLAHDISTELITMLRQWLTSHVAGTDMDYVPYLTATSSASRLPGFIQPPRASAAWRGVI